MPRIGASGHKLTVTVCALALAAGCATNPSNGEGAGRGIEKKTAAPAEVVYRPGQRLLPGQTDENPSDGMVVDQEKGVLSQGDVDHALRGSLPALTGCYERAGAAQKYVSGNVLLRFFVAASGQVADIHVIENGLGNYAVERCLVVEGRRIVFPPPGGRKDAEFDYPLSFRSSGEVPVVDWDADVLAKDVNALVPGLASCAAGAGHNIRAVAYIQPGGAVASVGLVSGETLDPTVAICLVEQIHKWRLPDDRTHVVRTSFALGGSGRSDSPASGTQRVQRRSRRVPRRS